MSTMNNFIIYQCDVCKRYSEVVNDGTRPDPTRCNITHKCRGKLKRTGESSIKRFLFTPPVIGLQDYVQRGTQISSSHTITEEPSVSLFTGGGSGMLTMFLLKRAESGSSHSFEVLDSNGVKFVLETNPNTVQLPSTITANLVLFKISPNLLQFKPYSYQVSGSVQVIRGIDDSLNANSLRFNSTNNVRVFINGVELDSSQYDRSVDDQITFTPAIYETNNVIDILVYNDLSSSISTSEIVKLKFDVLNSSDQTDLSFLTANSWGDSCSVKYKDERFLLHCCDISKLTPDFSYGISYLEISNGTTTKNVLPSEFGLLLGSSPYTSHDKELYSFLRGSNLLNGITVLYYGQDESTGLTEIRVVESVLTQLTRPLIPSRNVDLTSVESSTLVSQNKLNHQYVLGPV